jgi:hypothetical protein
LRVDMRKLMVPRLAILLLLVSSLAAPAYAYSVHVNKVEHFATSFQKLAMLSAAAPANVDAIWVERVVLEKFLSKNLQILPASVVRQVMFELEIKELTVENRRLLADKLGVDAFVVAAVDSAGTENAGTVGVFVGTVFTAVPSERNTGSVQLAIIAAESGKTLMEGTGYGQSELRSRKGVIGRTFAEIVNRAFPAAFFVERAKQ